MVARLLRRALLLESAAWLLLGAWMGFSFGASWVAAAVAIVAGPFAARLAFTIFALGLGRAWGTPREPGEGLGARGAVRLVAREYRALLVLNLLDVPFESSRLRPDPPARPLERPALLAVHGYGVNRGSLKPLVDRLEAEGLGPVYAPNLPSAGASLERFGEALTAEVERIAAATGRRVVVIGHSMGGLGARIHLAQGGVDRVAAVVTIASPHAGTRTAFLGAGENARQMRPASPFLAALAAREREAPPAVPFTCVYSIHDDVVMPQHTSTLPWARNVRVAGEGHLSLLDCEAVVAAVRDAARA